MCFDSGSCFPYIRKWALLASFYHLALPSLLFLQQQCSYRHCCFADSQCHYLQISLHVLWYVMSLCFTLWLYVLLHQMLCLSCSGLAGQDLTPMSLGLSHSLSRYKLKFSPDKVGYCSTSSILPCSVQLQFMLTSEGSCVATGHKRPTAACPLIVLQEFTLPHPLAPPTCPIHMPHPHAPPTCPSDAIYAASMLSTG